MPDQDRERHLTETCCIVLERRSEKKIGIHPQISKVCSMDLNQGKCSISILLIVDNDKRESATKKPSNL